MIEMILYFLHYALLLGFGIFLSFGFASIRMTKKNMIIGLVFFLCSGMAQLIVLYLFDESAVWKLYPWITHLPLMLLLMIVYKKSLSICIASIASAYLCCQPAEWFGLISYSISSSSAVNYCVRIVILAGAGAAVAFFFRPLLSQIFARKDKISFYFALIPVIYYLFDCTIGTYFSSWNPYAQIIVEFLPFFICVLFLIFSSVYYREYEQKMLAERKEHVIQIASDQQKREFELMKAKTHELRLLRHDMRLVMNQLALSIQNDDKETSLRIISEYVSEIDSTAVVQYCENESLNYVLSSYKHKCEALHIHFKTDIHLSHFDLDENMFCSIVLNALDNAVNAVKELDESKRFISIMLKNSSDKILLSVKNPYSVKPVFADGIPVASKKGHGFGTQSICFMTERLKGKYQFSVQNDLFILRIVI